MIVQKTDKGAYNLQNKNGKVLAKGFAGNQVKVYRVDPQ